MKRFVFIVLVSLGIISVAVLADQPDSSIVVIAHRSAPDSSLDKSAVLDFYTGDIKSWSDGQRVVLLDLDDHRDLRDRFFDYLGKTSSRMRSIWLKNMLSGEGQPPRALIDEDSVVRTVAATPGAIGFVSRDKVDDDVKVLLTIDN